MVSVARYQPSDHLLELTERAALAAGRLATAPAHALEAHRDAAVREQARLSARLDGSPLSTDTARRVDREGLAAVLEADGVRVAAGDDRTAGAQEEAAARESGWARALRLDRLPDQSVAAREYANLLACAEAETEVADSFFDRPLQALTRLHAVICDGLVAPDDVARLRRTDRAIHDGAQGQMLWAAPDPEAVGGLLDGLLDWLGGSSAARPTLIVAAVVHERILQWQPFEAANGRLARSAARVVRRARGLDPLGVAVPEALWHATTMAYHREVAATIRRRDDLSRWLERCAHAEAVALERAAEAVTGNVAAPVELPSQLLAYLAQLPPRAAVTPRDYAAQAGVSRERARADLAAARRAGVVVDDADVAGMRYRLVTATARDGAEA